MNKSITKLSFLIVLVFLSCQYEDIGEIKPRPSEVDAQELAKLKSAASCDEVQTELISRLTADMEKRVDDNYAYILEKKEFCRTYSDTGYNATPTETTDVAVASSGISDSGAHDYSETNNQVAGIDEADFIKNDGTYIYIVADKVFQILQAFPPEEAHVLSRVTIEGEPKRLFVYNNRVVIYSSLEAKHEETKNSSISYPSYPECMYGYDCDFSEDGKFLKITMLDISDKTNPTLLRETSFHGSYLNSRRIDNALYTVVIYPQNSIPSEISYYPKAFPYGYPSCDELEAYNGLELESLFNELKDINKTIIAEHNYSLPRIEDIRYGENQSQEESSNCNNYYVSQSHDGQSFLGLYALNINELAPINETIILGKPGTTYANEKSFYVATRHYAYAMNSWYFDNRDELQEATVVHKFQLDSTHVTATYKGSGVIKGNVLNQFSMDEYNGNLRIATSIGWMVSNSLSILKEENNELRLISSIDNIAPGEDIRSVRFNGNLGFIVTFKKTDPLFILDLSNPENPVIQGELQIPGFSTYMHMMDETHLLTIGYDADDQGEFAWFQGIMLQIFSIEDPKNPSLIHKEIIGTRGSTSDAATNHLAFNYFQEKNLLALPIAICDESTGGSSYGSDMTFNGLRVYDVTIEGGFKLKGGIPYQGSNPENDCNNWWAESNSTVKRSIIMDDYVYSVAGDIISISHTDDLENPIKNISLIDQSN